MVSKFQLARGSALLRWRFRFEITPSASDSPAGDRRFGENQIPLGAPKGSHAIYKNAEGKRATVPIHSGRTLHPKVLQNILRDAGLNVDEFVALL
jgi:hypothetical protein